MYCCIYVSIDDVLVPVLVGVLRPLVFLDLVADDHDRLGRGLRFIPPVAPRGEHRALVGRVVCRLVFPIMPVGASEAG